DLSTFVFPASFSQGSLQVSISTGGNYPGLAKKLRGKLENELGVEYGPYLVFLREMRQRVLALELDSMQTKSLLNEFLDDRYLYAAKHGNLETLKQAAIRQLHILKNKSN